MIWADDDPAGTTPDGSADAELYWHEPWDALDAEEMRRATLADEQIDERGAA